jgi:release factor glutamine methyltransferase
LAAEYLLRSILNLSHVDLYLEPNRPVSAAAESDFRSRVNRKLEREPLQYIIGETEWFGLTLKCDPRALIPRPETEILTERALELIADIEHPSVLDIGTGTGAIAIALAVTRPDAMVVATDSSAEELALAAENVATHRVQDRVDLRQGELFAPLAAAERFDLIISNPPYIRNGEYEGLMPEVRDYEPAEALLAGVDGLDVLRPLVEEACAYLKSGAWLILEFGIDHAAPVSQIAAGTKCYGKPVIVTDYNGQQRGLVLKRV